MVSKKYTDCEDEFFSIVKDVKITNSIYRLVIFLVITPDGEITESK